MLLNAIPVLAAVDVTTALSFWVNELGFDEEFQTEGFAGGMWPETACTLSRPARPGPDTRDDQFCQHAVSGTPSDQTRQMYPASARHTAHFFRPNAADVPGRARYRHFFRPNAADEHLSQALSSACWFNNIGAAAWLIEHGADIRYTSWNARADVDCMTNAEMYGDRFGDHTLFRYLQPWYENGRPLGDWRPLYGGFADHDVPVDEA